ncbi:class I SAM-dependent methyltransferase [Mucilaginibacter sp. FT3.2]|uniref:class I SAM-dependent methyltransferase n=1 Tax=Mucilaginibacter sp. FT3.2 TaxID=2723090 RepID=UPI0016210703|nr:class I SAM-dependent methyltransferase [Mucilaginibacter sp. FT3.2]MBB6233473.1 SAM-dependent methyltransferase [Mucilaginibacter sp. FT3.2]
MTTTDNSAIFDYHRSMIAFHGNHGPAALGWRDKESQLVRFQVLAQIANLEDCSVLDAGCGHGDLFSYLQSLYTKFTYVGVEQIPELLDEAKKRYGNFRDCTFLAGDFISEELPITDYVLASGSLNYVQQDHDFVFKAIAGLFKNCRIGLCFNLLRYIIPNGLLAAYDPQTILVYCKSLSDKVQMCLDYSEEDFTIFMYH